MFLFYTRVLPEFQFLLPKFHQILKFCPMFFCQNFDFWRIFLLFSCQKFRFLPNFFLFAKICIFAEFSIFFSKISIFAKRSIIFPKFRLFAKISIFCRIMNFCQKFLFFCRKFEFYQNFSVHIVRELIKYWTTNFPIEIHILNLFFVAGRI